MAGLAGAYVISRDPFHALATGGTPGFGFAITLHHRRSQVLAFCAAAAVFVGGWLCLGLLGYLMRGDSTVARIDSSIARWADRHATEPSESFLTVVTWLGTNTAIALFTILLLAFDWFRRHNLRVIAFLVVVVVGDSLITRFVKGLMDRARPAFNPIAETLGPSFPSGHSSLAAAFFAGAALLLSRERSKRATAVIGGVGVGLAVAVGISRVFLDVHWASDVIAGLALGWAWFAFCAIAFGALPRRYPPRTPALDGRSNFGRAGARVE